MLLFTFRAPAAELVNLSVEIDGWTMIPIVENGATAYIIAARNDDEALSTDIDVVLYEKTATGWEGTAYDPSVTKEDAMLDLADEFGLPDPFGEEWFAYIELDQSDVLEFILPRVGFGKGFFTNDPLYNVAELMNDPEPLAEAAEGSGLPAGSGAINTGSVSGGSDIGDPNPSGDGGCGCSSGACLQIAIAAGTDAYLADNNLSLEEIELVGYQTLQGIFGCCIPYDWTRGSITSTCTPTGAWTPTGSSTRPVTGGFRLTCSYSRPVTIFCTRKRVSRCFDCTRTTFNQSRTRTGTQTTSNSIDYSPTDPVPACPGPGGGAACGIVGQATTNTGWIPPIPPCP